MRRLALGGARGVGRAALGAVALAGAACFGTLSTSELPGDPIALVYRSPEESRERAEFLDDRDPESRREALSKRKAGIAPVDELRRQATSLLGGGARGSRKHAGRLALLDPRSGDVQVIESARRGAQPLDWSSDRRRLLFSQLESSYLQLFEFDREAGTVRTVTRGPEVHPRGCYGPDGRIVMMTIGVENELVKTRIVAAGRGGVRAVALSDGGREHSPACSPDGETVAWVASPERGHPQIWSRAPALDGEPRRLTPGREPTFSPDGEWIVYSAPVGGGWRLWRVRPDGTGRAPVGRGSLEELHPAVAPDGLYVAYVVETGYRPHLYVRRMDGSGDRILFRDGDGNNPVW